MDIDIAWLQELAREAGVRALFALKHMTGSMKADNTVVTNVDREIETFLKERLLAHFPDTGFLGEEFGFQGTEKEIRWAVDPIDGTTNLFHGMPIWGISIGLLRGSRPAAGVFYLPKMNEMFWGQAGKGSFLNGEPLRVEDLDEMGIEDTLCASSTAFREVDLSGTPGRLRGMGTIGTEICYTAARRFACCLSVRDKIYDVAAALCIAYEAGCSARWLSGDAVDLDDIIARRRSEAMIVAPPRLLDYLGRTLKPGRTV
ncbi:MAG: inositol monophosphatase [Armatimonadetes bacterium]|nr:inositol monophosphatase [Armatimonadota bacterium]